MEIIKTSEEIYEKPMHGGTRTEPYYHRISISIDINNNKLHIDKELYFLYGHGDHEIMNQICSYDHCYEVSFKTHNLEKINSILEKKMIDKLAKNIKKINRDLKNEIEEKQEILKQNEIKIQDLLVNHYREEKLKRILK